MKLESDSSYELLKDKPANELVPQDFERKNPPRRQKTGFTNFKKSKNRQEVIEDLRDQLNIQDKQVNQPRIDKKALPLKPEKLVHGFTDNIRQMTEAEQHTDWEVRKT